MKKDTPTCLTFCVIFFWGASFVVRIFNPAWSGGQALDASVMLIIGYWFASKATVSRKNGAPKT